MKHPYTMSSSLSLLVDLAAHSSPVTLYDAERIYAALYLECGPFDPSRIFVIRPGLYGE